LHKANALTRHRTNPSLLLLLLKHALSGSKQLCRHNQVAILILSQQTSGLSKCQE
jgi:hypothetical protein